MTSLARFITFEGIDGAGKSSHIEAVAALLRAAHFDCLCTREPGGTPLAEQLLVFAGRRDHLNTVIAPALAQGSAVLCDRFTDATFAYQGAGRGFDHAVLSQLEQWVQEGREPDLTLWFDLPPAVAAQRRGAARDPDRLEREAEAFFHRVRAGYEARARQAPDRVVRIDAAASMEAVRAQVLGVVSQRVLGLPSQQPAGAAPA
jgi:dTMP kinase